MAKHRTTRRVRPRWAWLVVLFLAAGTLPASHPPRDATRPPKAHVNVTSHGDLNRLWNDYGDTGGRWSGGDSTVSVRLPDGRTAWFFADTFIGRVEEDGARPRDAGFVHNTLVVQDGTALTTIHGGTPDDPASLVGTTGRGTRSDPLYWVNSALVENGELRAVYNQYARTGDDSLDVKLVGTAIATFSLPALDLVEVRKLPVGDRVGWGSATLTDGGYTYVYGTEASGRKKYAHVARVPAGGLSGQWEYWTGTRWSTDHHDSTRLLAGVGTGFGVARVGGEIVLLTQDATVVFSHHLVAYRAASAIGPFTGRTLVYTAPEAGKDRIVYDARIHPQLGTDTSLVVSYNVNDLDPDAGYTDARTYRPRFLNVGWPPRD